MSYQDTLKYQLHEASHFHSNRKHQLCSCRSRSLPMARINMRKLRKQLLSEIALWVPWTDPTLPDIHHLLCCIPYHCQSPLYHVYYLYWVYFQQIIVKKAPNLSEIVFPYSSKYQFLNKKLVFRWVIMESRFPSPVATPTYIFFPKKPRPSPLGIHPTWSKPRVRLKKIIIIFKECISKSYENDN